MKWMGYESAVEELAEKFHVSPGFLAELNPGKDLEKAGEVIVVPAVDRRPARRALRVVVSKSKRTVTAYGLGDKMLAQYPATMGGEHDPLPIGDWKVTSVHWYPVFHYNPKLFWDASPKQPRAEIKRGPNNPVGIVWIDINREHYGLHGSPEPSRIGHTESHGCVRMTNWDAARVASFAKPGTPVLFR